MIASNRVFRPIISFISSLFAPQLLHPFIINELCFQDLTIALIRLLRDRRVFLEYDLDRKIEFANFALSPNLYGWGLQEYLQVRESQ